MTITTSTRRNQHDGDGGSLVFAYGFRILDEDDLTVYVSNKDGTGTPTLQTITTDYTVQSVGNAGGGTITFTSAPASGELVTIICDPNLEQTLDLTSGDELPPESLEAVLDGITNQGKRSRDLAERSLSLRDGDFGTSGIYDANSNKITNLGGTPTDDNDAVMKSYVDARISSAQLAPADDIITALGGGYTIDDYRYLIDDTGATNRDLNERLTQTKSVKDFGVTGDGATDDTTAFQAAVDAGGWIYVPEGTYMLDEVLITTEVHLVLNSKAVLKQRSLTASQDQAILHFSTTGADRSTVEGGRFDGNIAVLQSSFTDEVMTAIRVSGVNYVKIRGVYIYDFLHTGWYFGSGSYSLFEDIWVSNCGKGCIHQNANYGEIRNCTFEDIDDHGEAIYQHATEIRDATGFTISNCVVTDYQPTATGLEPSPLAFAFERMDGMAATGLVAEGWSGAVPGTGQPVGFLFDNLRNSSVQGLSVSGGYSGGALVQSCENTSFSDGEIDLEYSSTGTSRHGVIVRNGGLGEPPASGLVSENTRANTGCANVHFSNIHVTSAADNGWLICSGEASFTGCSAMGCDDHGFTVSDALNNTLYVNPPTLTPRGVTFNGCRARNNGLAGIFLSEGDHIQITGGQFTNNGQDTAGVNSRSGIQLVTVDSVSINGVECSDNQSWATKTDGASFQPGGTVSNQYTVNLINPHYIELGQFITLADAGGAGVDATAKVIAKDLDQITVEISGGFTFVSTGNTTALTGTFDSSTYTLTGTGSALNTEIIGRTYVTEGSAWREISRVNSATSGVLFSAFASDLSGETLTKLTIDVEPIASQVHGIYVGNASTNVVINGVTGSGNSTALITAQAAVDDSINHIGASGYGIRQSIVAAPTVTIPLGVEYVLITGNTGINTLAAGWTGQRVTLEFSGTPAVADGSGIELTAAFTASAGDLLSLMYNGTNWIETGRSVI